MADDPGKPRYKYLDLSTVNKPDVTVRQDDPKTKLKYMPPPPEYKKKSETEPPPFHTILFEKAKENPFLPVGAVMTVSALGMGVYYLLKRDSKKSHLMMRARVASQIFLIGALYATITMDRKKFDRMRQRQDMDEKQGTS